MADETVLSGRELVLEVVNELLTDLDQGTAWDNDTFVRLLEGFGALLEFPLVKYLARPKGLEPLTF